MTVQIGKIFAMNEKLFTIVLCNILGGQLADLFCQFGQAFIDPIASGPCSAYKMYPNFYRIFEAYKELVLKSRLRFEN